MTDYSLSDIQAATGGGRNGGLFGGDFLSCILALFLIPLIFGGGMFGGGGWFGGNGGGVGAEVQRGFDTQTIVSKLDGITQGQCDATYALNNSLMTGFHGVDSAVCNLGYQTQNGFNALAAQIAQCCCDAREAISGVKFEVANQGCETRRAIEDSTRTIKDALNQQYVRSLERENGDLRLAASQANQNAILQAAMAANTAEIIRRTTTTTTTPETA